MRKIVIAIFAILMVTGLQAKEWNIPRGSYVCEIVSMNDSNWNAIKYFTKKQRETDKVGFVLSKVNMVDASGDVFTYRGKNSENTNVFINTENTIGVYLPLNSKKDGFYGIGMSILKNGKLYRMYMHCVNR